MIRYIQSELGAEVLPVDTDPAWGIHPALCGELPVYRFMPHTTRGEGLFMAVLRKSDAEDVEDRSTLIRNWSKRAQKDQKKGKKENRKESLSTFPKEIKDWIAEPARFSFETKADRLFAYPTVYAAEMAMLCDQLNPLTAGIPYRPGKKRGYSFKTSV